MNYNSSSSSSRRDEIMKRMKAPAWLEGLISESNFFGACGDHLSRRKNEMNIFCLHCCLSLCPHCLPSHSFHGPLLQIRRYVYHHVVRVADLDNLLDSSYIQPYTINGAKVIFLNDRPQSGQSRSPNSNVCLTCHRVLQHPFHFCSLSCKVDHMMFQGLDLSTILFTLHQSDFAFSQFQGLMPMDHAASDEPQITPYSISSEATTNSQETTITKNNNAFLSLGSRRKGAPQRAPMS